MRGRKAKPTDQKRLEGNPGRRPLNPHEPTPPRTPSLFADPPELLDHPLALAEWRRLALTLPTWITDADRGLLLAYCATYERWLMAETGARLIGGLVRQDAQGSRRANLDAIKLAGLANRTVVALKGIVAELGLTPSSRTRVHDAEAEPTGAAAPGADDGDMRGFVQ